MQTHSLTDLGIHKIEWEVSTSKYNLLKQVPGLLRKTDFQMLATFACIAGDLFPDAVILDIGTYCGKSAFIMALFGKLKVFSIDLHDGFRDGKFENAKTLEVARRYRDLLGLHKKVSFLIGDSSKIEWKKGNIGLLFVDGSHTYDAVVADYEHFKPFLLDGAFVLFHDYGLNHHPEVRPAVDSLKDIVRLDIVRSMFIGRYSGGLSEHNISTKGHD